MSEAEASGHRIDRPRLRIVRGDATPEEIAALVTAVSAQARAARTAATVAETRRSRPASRWADRSRLLRRPLPQGPDAWRAALR